MSENLSFTQELRKQGLIQDDAESETVPNDSIDVVEEQQQPEIVNETSDEQEDSNNDSNIMYIGKKPSMNYVLTINTKMLDGVDEIIIRARGRTISKAVDVAEIVTNRFITDANDSDITIGTEEVHQENGKKTNVSTIEIVVKR